MTTIRITTLRHHGPRSEARDRAILDLLELQERDMLPGIVTTAGLMAIWRCSRSMVSRRLAAIHALPGWRVQHEAGPYACIWIGPCLRTAPPRPLSTRERWERVRESLRERVGL